MKLKIFTVFDSKAEAFLQPFFTSTTGLAIREFSTAVNQQDHQFNKYAGDYTLFELGSYEQDNAKFSILPTPINLGVAITFLQEAVLEHPRLTTPIRPEGLTNGGAVQGGE